ncbi:MAG: hypothetical protein VB117_06140 [[Clostridium] scindens]|nr:hypothetical protein [[Clostridium] scindens]
MEGQERIWHGIVQAKRDEPVRAILAQLENVKRIRFPCAILLFHASVEVQRGEAERFVDFVSGFEVHNCAVTVHDAAPVNGSGISVFFVVGGVFDLVPLHGVFAAKL